MTENKPFDQLKLEKHKDVPDVAKRIVSLFLEGYSVEELAEEYKVNGDFIEELLRHTSIKIGADMIVEVLLNG